MASLFSRKPISELLAEEGHPNALKRALGAGDPSRPRPFRVPFVWPGTILGAAACIYTMCGLPGTAWKRFGIWLAIGLVLYFTYGFKHSTLRRGTPPVPITPPA